MIGQVVQVLDIISIVYFHPEILSRLKVEINIYIPNPARVQIISDNFCFTNFGFLIALYLKEDTKRISFGAHIHVWKVCTFKGQTQFLF